MARVSYDIEILEEGRHYHSFEITCPFCHEKGLAILDTKEMEIIEISRGQLDGNANDDPNIVFCKMCACLFRIEPKIEVEHNEISDLLRAMKFSEWADMGKFIPDMHEHEPPKVLKKPLKKTVKRSKKIVRIQAKKARVKSAAPARKRK